MHLKNKDYSSVYREQVFMFCVRLYMEYNEFYLSAALEGWPVYCGACPHIKESSEEISLVQRKYKLKLVHITC
jgi:hypothetical protein